LARYGGEEFVVVLPKTNEEEAAQIAASMLEEVWNCNIPHKRSDFKRITVSIGVATQRAKEIGNKDEFLNIADARMYKAKQNGKNQFVDNGSDISD
jgi:diguanylate cyclase (GGDEF)-like protein